MSDNELLLAISDIIEESIKKDEHNIYIRTLRRMRKFNYSDPYEYIESMEAIFPQSWNNEDESIYQKYKEQIDKEESFETNLEIIKCVVNEHCERLSDMKI